MSNEHRTGIVGVMLAVVMGGLFIAWFALGGPGGASPSSTPGPLASPSASAAPSEIASSSPSIAPTATDSPSPEPSPTSSPTPEPTSTGTPVPSPAADAATATVMALKLDATDNPDGQDVELHFQAVGAGQVLARVIVHSPRGQVRMCLSSPKTDLACTTSADGRLSADHTGDPTDYTLTLRGDGAVEPIVDVTVSFPSDSPALTIANARFDGTGFPDTNGLQVQVTPRAAGDLGLVAEWGGHPFIYEIDLTGPSGSGDQTLDNQGPATRVDTSFPVEPPGSWLLVLRNAEVGFGPTGLNASITWP
jgi:hypothetical protein